MSDGEPIYIAGMKTAEDWRELRDQLIQDNRTELWIMAFEEFYLERLRLRYFEPIRILQENSTYRGEGFSIVAIQCTLIEFLESTIQGISYRFLRAGERLGPFEYVSSKDLFINFLCTRRPFSASFDSNLAADFYANIRCGLLHEARTKNGWKIWAESHEGKIVDPINRAVFRNNLHQSFLEFTNLYRTGLIQDSEYQQAFIRKFDNLCT